MQAIPPSVVEVADPRLRGIEKLLPDHVNVVAFSPRWSLNPRAYRVFLVAFRCFVMAGLPLVFIDAFRGDPVAIFGAILFPLLAVVLMVALALHDAEAVVARGDLEAAERHASSPWTAGKADQLRARIAYQRSEMELAAQLAEQVLKSRPVRAQPSIQPLWQLFRARALAYAGRSAEARALLPVTPLAAEHGIHLHFRLLTELSIAFCERAPRVDPEVLALAAAAGRRSPTSHGLLVLAAWAYEARGWTTEARKLLEEDSQKPGTGVAPAALLAWRDEAFRRLGVEVRLPATPKYAAPRSHRWLYVASFVAGLLGTIWLLYLR
jgi:hypothetical protein